MRIAFDIVLISSALFLPMWVTIVLMSVGFFLFVHFWESIIVATLIEFWFHGAQSNLFGTRLSFVALIFVTFIVVEIARSFIREQVL